MKNESLKKNNITKNTEYLLKSREESKLSFSSKSGITRSTIYKLLNGEVRKLQTTTIEKIADFFGVSAKMLESTDIERLEASEKNLSITGNMNPICVPIIEESNSIMLLNENIGDLILSKKTTYCYTVESNVICLELEEDKAPFYEKSELIFIRRFFKGKNNEPLVLFNKNNKIEIASNAKADQDIIGYIIEERSCRYG